MSDVDPSHDGRRARGRLRPLPPEAPRGLWATCCTRGSPLDTRSSRPATCDSCSGCAGEAASGTRHSWLPPAGSLSVLEAARYTVLADDNHANEAPRVPSRKTTALRRIPVAVPES
jgi:hypothetical protein